MAEVKVRDILPKLEEAKQLPAQMPQRKIVYEPAVEILPPERQPDGTIRVEIKHDIHVRVDVVHRVEAQPFPVAPPSVHPVIAPSVNRIPQSISPPGPTLSGRELRTLGLLTAAAVLLPIWVWLGDKVAQFAPGHCLIAGMIVVAGLAASFPIGWIILLLVALRSLGVL